jgi:hypothetical protein
MEAIVVLLVIVAGLVMLDAASAAWGVDSRDVVADDHRRVNERGI